MLVEHQAVLDNCDQVLASLVTDVQDPHSAGQIYQAPEAKAWVISEDKMATIVGVRSRILFHMDIPKMNGAETSMQILMPLAGISVSQGATAPPILTKLSLFFCTD